MKNYDVWNRRKKEVELYKQRKRYHAGDFWWAHLGLNIGFEQDGKNKNFERPVLIIKGFNKEVCLIVPLTTKDKKNRFSLFVGEFNGHKNYAILSQIRLIDTKRLINKIGSINKSALRTIKKAIWDIIR